MVGSGSCARLLHARRAPALLEPRAGAAGVPEVPCAALDVAWPAFEAARATYARRLEAMATYWATPATSWLGDPMELRLPIHQPDDA